MHHEYQNQACSIPRNIHRCWYNSWNVARVETTGAGAWGEREAQTRCGKTRSRWNRLKGLKARVLAVEAAQDEKEEALSYRLNEKGREDIAKFKREGKHLFTIKEQVSALEEDVMA